MSDQDQAPNLISRLKTQYGNMPRTQKLLIWAITTTLACGLLPPIAIALALAAIILWVVYFLERSKLRRAAQKETHAKEAERQQWISAIRATHDGPKPLPDYGQGPRHRYVQVTYRDFSEEITDYDAYGYSYIWSSTISPQIGMRVYAPTSNGIMQAAVIRFGRGDTAGMQLERITRPLTRQEDTYWAEKRANLQAEYILNRRIWFEQAKAALGRPHDATLTAMEVPVGAVLPIPSLADPQASLEVADEQGKAWWRIFKDAQREGLPDEDVKAFGQAARAWFKIRDQRQQHPDLNGMPHAALTDNTEHRMHDVQSEEDGA